MLPIVDCVILVWSMIDIKLLYLYNFACNKSKAWKSQNHVCISDNFFSDSANDLEDLLVGDRVNESIHRKVFVFCQIIHTYNPNQNSE